MRPSPCYDPIRKIDCPRRCAGCSATCKDWDEYVAERNETYRQRAVEHEAKSVIFNVASRRARKYQRAKMYDRQNVVRGKH